jgi:RNA polymerase sigma-70 factor (ECF subfamily)
LNPESDPDVQLMLAVQRDDRAAFEALFRKHAAAITGFALSFVGSRARAEELAQETFVHLYRARKNYKPQARFSTWLYRIATNLCVSEMRRPEHRSIVPAPSPPDAEGDPIDRLADPMAMSGEDAAVVSESIDRLREGLQKLPAQQRAALLLARAEGLSYDEVAAALGCSVAAVKSLIHRATVTLRESENG